MYHPDEVAKLKKLTEQYELGLLAAEDVIFRTMEILEDEVARQAAMVMPKLTQLEEQLYN